MRILLIYPGRLLFGEQPLGVLYLSAALKQAGHETRVWIPHLIDYLTRRFTFSRGNLLRQIEQFDPQLVGISVDSTTFPYALQIAKIVKMHTEVPVIFGGPHPTVDPEGTIADPLVDMICVGEGEKALVELVGKIEGNGDTTTVENIWGKANGQTFRNPVRRLLDELDSLPYPDRDALDSSIYCKQGFNLITSRGCPYNCTYCIESYLHCLYKGKGWQLRFRDTSEVIRELKEAVQRYQPKLIVFSDETFTANRERCREFCDQYEEEVGVPFNCQTRANTVDRKTLKALQSAGCTGISIGIESGNDYLRNEIMERGLSREIIVNAFALAREIGLNATSFNQVGAPFETEATIWETIRLNREVKPDNLQISIMMPFKGTKIRDIFEENNWLVPEDKINDYNLTILQRQPTVSRYRLLSYATFFEVYVKSAEKYHSLLNVLRRGYELLLRLLPGNSLLQRAVQLIMVRNLRVFLRL